MNPTPSHRTPRKKPPLSVLGAYRSYQFMGAHPAVENGVSGWRFRVWAPVAKAVSVVGDFNRWDNDAHPMYAEAGGVWTRFIPSLHQYDTYKYAIRTATGGMLLKADPYAFHAETRPNTASKLFDLSGYQWQDEHWLRFRQTETAQTAPINLYEVHLGSWRRTGDGEVLNYREIARYLVPYVKEMGYTGVKFLPVGEHPLDDSLGYQLTGYFAVTSRFGTPTDFMYLVDQLHQAGVSVILDSVSTGFPKDDFGLYLFDGVPCYGVPDPLLVSPARKPRRRKRSAILHDYEPETFSAPSSEVCEFDCSKPEVCNFLISSVFFWLELFHVDGIHFTGTPIESADFITALNKEVHREFPYAITFAGEPQELEGFDHCWDTDWVEQMLNRLTDPERTDSVFAVAPRPMNTSVLPLSHDLVAAPNPSLANRMLGDNDLKFAQVRAFYLFFLTQPGSKLTMMGTEFGQWDSWNCHQSLDWHLMQYRFYQNQQHFFRDANALYLSTPAFWESDKNASFRKILTGEGNSVLAYVRRGTDGEDYYIVVNFSLKQTQPRVDVTCAGHYQVVFSTDLPCYNGLGKASHGAITTRMGAEGAFVPLFLPAMSAVVLRCVRHAPQLRESFQETLRDKKSTPHDVKSASLP